jgi:hypothetical protein
VRTDKTAKALKRPIHPNLPDLEKGFVMAIVAPRHSGKTTLYTNLLLNPQMFGRENYDYCFICSPTVLNDDTAQHLRDNFSSTIYPKYEDSIVKDLITFQKSFPKEDRPKSIFVLDDNVGGKTPQLDYLTTRSRHFNIGGLIISTQQAKSIKKVARNNLTDVMLGRTKNNKELEDYYQEWGALYGDRDEFGKMYNYATKDPYSMLYLKMDSNPPRAFKNFSEEITHKFNQSDKTVNELE